MTRCADKLLIVFQDHVPGLWGMPNYTSQRAPAVRDRRGTEMSGTPTGNIGCKNVY